MTYQFKVIIIGALAVLVFDALASLASKRLGFAYAKASLGSYLLYVAVGYFAARGGGSSPITMAALAAGICGFVDASAGWALSWALGPGALPSGMRLTMSRWATTAAIVVVLASATGAIGGLMGRSSAPMVTAVSNR